MEALGESLRVLVVDDEATVGLAIKSVLKFCGYEAVLAGSGRNALEMVRAAPSAFALVLTDHNMPDFSGMDLVQSLRNIQFPGKIIVLSAFLDGKTEAEYGRLNVDQIIGKPFDLVELRNHVNRLLQPARHQTQVAHPAHVA